MARKNKSKQGRRNQTEFKDILLKFQQEDYAGAYNLFKKSKITSEEAGKAKQLKAMILHQVAFQYFLNKEYVDAIRVLSPNLLVQSKAGFPLPLDITHLLLGLSHLYLGQFDKAVGFLEKASPQTNEVASFYHLLSLIYAHKNEQPSLDDFLVNHQAVIATLPQNLQTYVKTGWNLVHENFDEADALLSKLSLENEKEEQNVAILQGVLQQKTLPKEADATNIKTLYKVLAGMDAEQKERAYLEQFDEFEEYLFANEKQDRSEGLEQQLSLMCNEGIVLEDDTFQACFDAVRDDLKPHLVYNQIANLYNAINERELDRVFRYFRKHIDLFLQVPESGLLYLEIAEIKNSKIRPQTFWKAVSNYVDRFESTWSPRQLDDFSWKIQACCLGSNFIDFGKESASIDFCIKHPNMVGLKFHFLLQATIQKYKRLPDELKDVFSLENITDNKEKLLAEFLNFSQSFYPETFSLMSIFHDDENPIEDEESVDLFINIHLYFQDNILECITLHPQIADKSILREIYKIINDSVNKLVKEYTSIINEQDFFVLENKIKKALTLLELEKEILPFKSLENTLLENSKKEDLDDIFAPITTNQKAKKIFLKYIRAGDVTLLIDAFMHHLDEEHYEGFLIPKLTLIFKLIVEELPEEAAAILLDFNDRYQSLLDEAYCNHPHEFYCKWLKDLFKSTKPSKYHSYVYILIESYAPELTSKMEPINYNTASQALGFIVKAIEASPDFKYDLDLIINLIVSIKMAIKAKRLKTIAVSLAKVESFFNDLEVSS